MLNCLKLYLKGTPLALAPSSMVVCGVERTQYILFVRSENVFPLNFKCPVGPKLRLTISYRKLNAF